MWRAESVHERGTTEYLDAAMERIERDAVLRGRADATMGALRGDAVFQVLWRTPQSPTHHAEGPFVADHVRLALMTLNAIVEDKLHLIDIEEFRRLKGFEGEIDELEETVKERAASIETFVLCHDLGKPSTVWFEAKSGSRGDQLGFNLPLAHAWTDEGARVRAELLAKFLELYDAFAAERPNDLPAVVQAEFFLAFQIGIHYHGHAHAIAHPDLRHALVRVADARRLTAEEKNDVFHLIILHMDAITGFDRVNLSAYDRLVSYANAYGRDADDFLDLFLAGLLLDGVCGSRRRGAHGVWHDTSLVEYFLRAEHAYAPWKWAEKERAREAVRRQSERARFRAAGLDGDALLALTGMKPGPAFGLLINRLHLAIRGEGAWPELPFALRDEVAKRIERFRTL